MRMDLAAILAPRTAQDDPEALPRAEGARANVQQVRLRARQEGLVGDWACAQGLSRRWGAKAAPRSVMPCLLHSNSVGYWLGSRGRTASVAEHARAQGLEHGACRWPRDTASFALLGNSMARCILQRLIHGILCSCLRGRTLAEGRGPSTPSC